MGKADGEVTQLVLVAGDGQLAKRFNVVIVAEGYRKVDQATFEADALAVANAIVGAEPFAGLAAAINIFRLDVWSTDCGADRGADLVATYFDAKFDDTTPWLLLADATLVTQTVQAALSDDAGDAHAHKIIVLVNTEIDGGSGGIDGGVAVSSRAVGALTMLHELGHLFGLVDEYDIPSKALVLAMVNPLHLDAAEADATGVPNLSISCTREDLPWKDLVDTDTPIPTDGHPVTESTIGAFEVGFYSTHNYRPQWRCRMRHTMTNYFCTVCARHIGRALKTAL